MPTETTLTPEQLILKKQMLTDFKKVFRQQMREKYNPETEKMSEQMLAEFKEKYKGLDE